MGGKSDGGGRGKRAGNVGSRHRKGACVECRHKQRKSGRRVRAGIAPVRRRRQETANEGLLTAHVSSGCGARCGMRRGETRLKEGRKAGRKKGRKKGRKEDRKENKAGQVRWRRRVGAGQYQKRAKEAPKKRERNGQAQTRARRRRGAVEGKPERSSLQFAPPSRAARPVVRPGRLRGPSRGATALASSGFGGRDARREDAGEVEDGGIKAKKEEKKKRRKMGLGGRVARRGGREKGQTRKETKNTWGRKPKVKTMRFAGRGAGRLDRRRTARHAPRVGRWAREWRCGGGRLSRSAEKG